MTAFIEIEHLVQELPWIGQREPSFAAWETATREESFQGRESERRGSDVQGPLGDGGLPPEPPLTPFDPFNPRNPMERRPLPQRPFRDSRPVAPEPRLLLVAVCEDVPAVPIIPDHPGGVKDDESLTVASGHVDGSVMTGSSLISRLPCLDVDQGSSRDRRGVLWIRHPTRASRISLGDRPWLGGW